MSAGEAIPILMDVDTGVDDAMAIALAVRSPLADLVAVTTVAGNVSLDKTTENTLRVLAWLGSERVPVYAGMSAPLARSLHDAADFHGATGLGAFSPPSSPVPLGELTAPEVMVRSARQRPGELTFVCVGPLTNLAVALRLEPELPRLLRRLVIMGGAFRVPGNVTQAAEFNIYVDPEAAALVARADVRATFIGLDVTRQTALSRDAWQRLAAIEKPAAQLIWAVCRDAFERRGSDRVHLHDPLALAVALRPEFVTCRQAAVAIETGTEATIGETSLVDDPLRAQHQVALEVNVDAFLAYFERTLDLVNLTGA